VRACEKAAALATIFFTLSESAKSEALVSHRHPDHRPYPRAPIDAVIERGRDRVDLGGPERTDGDRGSIP